MKKYLQFILEKLRENQEIYLQKIVNYLKNNAPSDLFGYDEDFTIKKKGINKELTGKLFFVLEPEGEFKEKAIRFNFDKEQLYSVDFWEKFEFNYETIHNKPDYTVDNVSSFVNVVDDIVAFMDGDFDVLNEKETQAQSEFKKAPEEEVDMKGFDKAILDEDVDVFDSIKLYTAQVAYKVSNSLVISGLPGLGKCLAKGTKVIMYDGSLKCVENVVEGDLLMGVDSKPRKAYGITKGISNMYKVKQNKSIDYVVNEDHILSLKKSKKAINQNWFSDEPQIKNISIKEFLEKPKYWKDNFHGYKVEVEFPEKELEIDPYYLGVWLGDGTSIETTITNEDIEVEDFLYEYANDLGMECRKRKYENKATQYKISSYGTNQPNPLLRKLKEFDLYHNKHIPNDYLYNSYDNRMRLLAGLIDSDGYLQTDKQKNGVGYSITMKSENMINQIKYLCDTLGFRTSVKKIKRGIKELNFESHYFRLNINGYVEEIPVKIERKKINSLKHRVDHKVTAINVEEFGEGEYYGFNLSGDGLFLLEDCTVTHNTFDVENTLDTMRVDYVPVSGDITTAGLFEILFKNRDKLILFDDMDSVFDSKESINLLKAVLDTKPKRKVSRILKTHFDSFGMSDDEIQKIYDETNRLPKQFEFTGRIIFITNEPGDEIDSALISRSLFVDVNPDFDKVLDRINSIIPNIKPEVSMEIKKEIINFMLLMNEQFELRFPVNLRTFIHCLNIRVANEGLMMGELPAWQALTKLYLIKK